MINNVLRIGNFTSSEIVALTKKGHSAGSFGKPAFTYIEECNMERRLGRAVSEEVFARPFSWGKLGERRVFRKLLGTEYRISNTQTIQHRSVPFWVGSPDATKDVDDTVSEVKCPMTLKSFCQLVDPYIVEGKIIHPALTIAAVRANHDDGEKFYWQIVSNACITGKKYGELIIYCPYQRELEDLRDLARSIDGPEQSQFYWIAMANDDELPSLVEGGHYKNLNIIRFEIPYQDKVWLHKRVVEAGTHLEEFRPVLNPVF